MVESGRRSQVGQLNLLKRREGGREVRKEGGRDGGKGKRGGIVKQERMRPSPHFLSISVILQFITFLFSLSPSLPPSFPSYLCKQRHYLLVLPPRLGHVRD